MIRAEFRMSGRNSAARRWLLRRAGEPAGRPAMWNPCGVNASLRSRVAASLGRRVAIGGDYKRTTMRMAQLYGPLKARRCVTPCAPCCSERGEERSGSGSASAAYLRSEDPFCLGRVSLPRARAGGCKGAMNIAVY